MPAYFGSGGALFEVKCPATADRMSTRPVSFTRTLGGKVKSFVGRGARRSWSLEVGAGTPQDVSTVEALSRAPGPLVWVSPDAAVGNLLSPQASAWDRTPANTLDAGLVGLPDGTVARAVVHTGGGTVAVGDAHGSYEMVPVRPGEPVTAGAWALTNVRLTGFWRDAGGTSIGSFLGTPYTFNGWQWRESTFTPPAGAAFLQLNLSTGSQYALPSVSWGAKAARELGAGCPKAVLHDGEYSPLGARPSLNRSRITYSVTEVG